MNRIFTVISLLLAYIFTYIVISARALFSDLNNYFGLDIPLFPILVAVGGLTFLGSLALLQAPPVSPRRARALRIALAVGDVLMLAMLVVLLTQSTPEGSLLREATLGALPAFLWFSAAAALFFFAPSLPWLRDWRLRLLCLGALGLAALLWQSLPWQVVIEGRPLVFIRQGGLTAAWRTNMPATATLRYGTTPEQTRTSQTDGLLDLNGHIQRVYLPGLPQGEALRLQAVSRGVKNVFPVSAELAGTAESAVVDVPFPPKGASIAFAAFSDLHEQTGMYARLASHVDWAGMDLAVFTGDLVTSTLNDRQLGRTLFNLPTGGRDLPRVYALGNHDHRAKGARQMADWLLPPGGKWYFSFPMGNTFFVVLDSGEDKADGDKEYNGLIDFTSYHREQARWLGEVFDSPEYQSATYRILILHTPLHAYTSPAFDPVKTLINARQDIDLMVSGHTHERGLWLPAESGLPYPLAVGGGYRLDDAAVVLVSAGKTSLAVNVVDVDGRVLKSAVLPKKP